MNEKSKSNALNFSPNKEGNLYKDIKNPKVASSRQQKKTPAFISTQYKSIENQINSPEKPDEDGKNASQI